MFQLPYTAEGLIMSYFIKMTGTMYAISNDSDSGVFQCTEEEMVQFEQTLEVERLKYAKNPGMKLRGADAAQEVWYAEANRSQDQVSNAMHKDEEGEGGYTSTVRWLHHCRFTNQSWWCSSALWHSYND